MSSRSQQTESDDEDFGLPTQAQAAASKIREPKSCAAKPKACPGLKRPAQLPIQSKDINVITARLDVMESEIKRMKNEVSEILNIVKSIQTVLPRVLSSNPTNTFNTMGRTTNPTSYFMP